MERRHFILGLGLVAASAVLWSLGGTFARFISFEDAWLRVFWRAFFATVFLLCFMIWQRGADGMTHDISRMGWPGFIVALCFAGASTSFVVALNHTTVANILLVQAGVPLLAALLAYVMFRERVNVPTWLAILTVFVGVAVMVSESFTGATSAIGDGLSLFIAVLFAIATVVTRRYANVRMTPAVTLGTFISFVFAIFMGGADLVSLPDLGWLSAFGALNLGLGLACFALGVRHVPAAVAALVGTIEPVLGPLWVWLVHGETASQRTLMGGAIVCTALIVHILVDMLRTRATPKTGLRHR